MFEINTKHIERQSSGNLKTYLIHNAATVREYKANELHNPAIVGICLVESV